jgi:septal ring factor EnvC (AmiA/AmiB activator)
MEEAEMEQGFDLPGTPEAGQPVVPAPLSPSELGSGEVGKLVEEFERRIAHLENRLEEVVDAKERLERQVAAQTEELRVQRAAIARTQRVLRTIARPEDEISEPAPKP